MNTSRFISGLSGVVVFSAIVQSLLLSHTYFHGFLALVGFAMIFFTLFSVILFWVSRRAAIHENPYFFIYVSYMAILIKLVCSIGMVWWYQRVYSPPNNHYVLLFIIIYITFTIFETYFMSRLGRFRPHKLKS